MKIVKCARCGSEAFVQKSENREFRVKCKTCYNHTIYCKDKLVAIALWNCHNEDITFDKENEQK